MNGDSRGDLALFVRRVRDLMTAPALTCRATTSIGAAAALMTRHGVGSLVVVADSGAPIGILTDRDLRSKVVARGLATTTPVTAIMSAPLVSIDGDRVAFDALLEMTRRNIHHLGVIEGDRLCGVVSSHDLTRLQGMHPVSLAREIDDQASVEGLAILAPRLPEVVRWLARGGAAVFDVGRIVAELNDRFVRRTLDLTEAALDAEGRARPPVAYSWLAAGSEGRREQTLKTDQDNGLVYEDPPAELAATVTTYFAHLAGRVGEALVRLGFPPCDGGFMASNPQWCQSGSTWRGYFAAWMETPGPDDILRASLFCDMRPVGGDEAPGRRLWGWVCDQAPRHTVFLRHMAKAAVEQRSPLGFFRRFAVERSGAHRGRLDVKARGVFPMTQAIRVYALSLGLPETNTVERLTRTGACQALTAAEVQELRDAYEVISRIRLHHQLSRREAGELPDNFVDPQTLGKSDRLLLREAFRTLAWLQRYVAERFQTGLLG